ncbi:hypothetical protein A176_002119 [Myxococcus hansupus]|uniref:Uncharacterized protein n=1 Tax=Pseudomyxococcus hansupus TaxID=1297742 RepID=A0A0H4XBD0_9BACT|nr:hypothetical protein A176_002119 [Myxococcus hansupus]
MIAAHGIQHQPHPHPLLARQASWADVRLLPAGGRAARSTPGTLQGGNGWLPALENARPECVPKDGRCLRTASGIDGAQEITGIRALSH